MTPEVPAAPHELSAALWQACYVFGGVIAIVAGAFSSLVWWVLRTTRADRTECRNENAQLRKEMSASHAQQHTQTLAFVHAIDDVSQVLRSLRSEVRRKKPVELKPGETPPSETDSDTHDAISAVQLPDVRSLYQSLYPEKP